MQVPLPVMAVKMPPTKPLMKSAVAFQKLNS